MSKHQSIQEPPLAEDDELENFRRQWKREIDIAACTPQAASVKGPVPCEKAHKDVRWKPNGSASLTSLSEVGDTHPVDSKAGHAEDAEPLTVEQSAIQQYGVAVLAERQGRVNDALRAYRSAFRKRDDVDKLYHVAQMRKGDASADERSINTSDSLSFQFERTIQLQPDYDASASKSKRSRGNQTSQYALRLRQSCLAHPYDREHPYDTRSEDVNRLLQQKAKQELHFYPRSNLRPVFLAKLPDEIVLAILDHLTRLSVNAQYPDVASLECGWALTCRKARLLSLEASGLWRRMCEGVYMLPSQIPSMTSASTLRSLDFGPTQRNHPSCAVICSSIYYGDWRLMWIEHPRIRTDGVYISQITYLRRGAHDGTTYYDPTHLVTYYRYLVFLPSGDVVSLLSHDVPSAMVPNLLALGQSAKTAAGYTVGRWRIIRGQAGPSADGVGAAGHGPIVQLSSLEDPRASDARAVKYSFEMLCRLKSTSRGKMNKLEMVSLATINHNTDDRCEIPIRQANNALPNFYFSRVRSYD